MSAVRVEDLVRATIAANITTTAATGAAVIVVVIVLRHVGKW